MSSLERQVRRPPRSRPSERSGEGSDRPTPAVRRSPRSPRFPSRPPNVELPATPPTASELRRKMAKRMEERKTLRRQLEILIQNMLIEISEKKELADKEQEKLTEMLAQNRALKRKLWELELLPEQVAVLEQKVRTLKAEIDAVKNNSGLGSSPESTSADNNKIPPKKKGDKIKKLLGNDYQAEELIEMEGITILKSEYGSLEVKGGTSEKLIAWLYDCNVPVVDYFNSFLLTYRSFTTPRELFESLAKAYEDLFVASTQTGSASLSDGDKQKNKQKRLRICNFFRHWVEKYFYDFDEDRELMDSFWSFIENKVEVMDGSVFSQRLRTSLKKQLHGKNRGPAHFDQAPPDAILPKNTTNFSLIDLSPLEIARQLTLREDNMYKKIHPKECLDFIGPEKESRCPNIMMMINKFNRVSGWVASTILREEDLRQRSKVLELWIKVMESFDSLNNFNGVMEILAGLETAGVHRLKKTWDAVPRARTKNYDKMKRLMSTDENAKVYRSAVHSRNPPLVPYLGRYITDLTFINDGNKKILQNGYINFYKCRMIAEVISEIQQYQQLPYNLNRVPFIEDYCQKIEIFSEDDQYKQSLLVEPRERKVA